MEGSSAPTAGRIGAGAVDRLRKRGSAAAGAGTAKAARIRGAHRDGDGSHGTSKKGHDGEPIAGANWRGIGVGLALAAVKLFKTIAGNAVPRLDGVTVGWAVLGWGLGIAVFPRFSRGFSRR